jgi:hypothetical protein
VGQGLLSIRTINIIAHYDGNDVNICMWKLGSEIVLSV